MDLSRRLFLKSAAALTGVLTFAACAPRPARSAGARDPRLVVILLRGALDGLTAVPPVGDRDYAALRGALAIDPALTLPLEGPFALHPALTNLSRQYTQGQALIVHAAASPYRERSHFDGQDVLETGLPGPGRIDSGWLNRLITALPPDERIPLKGLGVSTTTPLLMRGPSEVLGWTPEGPDLQDDSLPRRLLSLYQARGDEALTEALDAAMRTEELLGDMRTPDNVRGTARIMRVTATGAAKLMSRPDGPRIAALSYNGWDTHTGEAHRLDTLLTGLDGAYAAFERQLGDAWKDTVIVTVTEFGRTAAINGTDGTDHGTGTIAVLNGGAVSGGRVIADWPGLSPDSLYQQRDLRPTTDLRAVFKGVIQGLYDLPSMALSSDIFPDSGFVSPMRDLIA